MRTIEIKCDCCGITKPTEHKPLTWWRLEEESAVLRTGGCDFCSLRCLQRWLADEAVRRAFAADFSSAEREAYAKQMHLQHPGTFVTPDEEMARYAWSADTTEVA